MLTSHERRRRALRLGEILVGAIPETIDETELDLILRAVEKSSIPEALGDIVFAVVGADDDAL